MNATNFLAFAIFPYVALAIFVIGNLYRYASDQYNWNPKSSEILSKGNLKVGITLFHYGIILTLLGHAGGLLIPQRVYDALGIDGETHTRIAIYVGFIVGLAALLGIITLIWRRATDRRVRVANTNITVIVTLALLVFTIGAGMYNVLFGHYYVLDTIAPWIRGILILKPDPTLMLDVPLSYKIHILGGFALIGFSPFSRLVHIWSVPITYLFRRWIIFRRREVNI
jgi:nitrate reductase gamma subunit